MPDRVIGLMGAALVVVVALDIFRSLLVPRASARWLRVGPLLTHTLFGGWHATARRINDRQLQQTMRASLAPLMLVLLLVIWATLLIVGFGLVFWADRANFTPQFKSLGDAIYASGSAFSTLGIVNEVRDPLTRFMVLVCSISGLAIVTVVATFLISLQSGLGRREAMVLRLEAHVPLPPTGVAILETFAREQVVERLGAFFDAWEQWAAEVAISHRAFPILVFFRSNDSRCEWLAALGAVLDAAALLDAVVADPPTGARAGAHFFLRTGTRLVTDVGGQFRAIADREEPDHVRFDEHRQRLAAAGFDLVEDVSASRSRYAEHRDGYAVALCALADRLQIDIDGHEAGRSRSA